MKAESMDNAIIMKVTGLSFAEIEAL